jgi:hypothetical protein
MDSRLQRIGGSRPTHVRRSDVPRLAQAIVDAAKGRAQVRSGKLRDTSFVEFVRPRSYTVVVRGDDWRKIFPFFRYSTTVFQPVIPPGNPPSAVVSPQPNRVMQPPPEKPSAGLRSFLDRLRYDEYQKIQGLLTMLSAGESPSLPFKPSRGIPDASHLIPSEKREGTLTQEDMFFNRLVLVLQELFPVDYPTRF